MTADSLSFHVAPHIVEDLGLNLYTSLPRVLVELVANAYDADAPSAKIYMNHTQIKAARFNAKAQWEAAKIEAVSQPGLALESATLPADLKIMIEDDGCGMSRADLENKYLFLGRRRRAAEHTSYSPKGRRVMGRKGLGKLSGFGVAHRITVQSKVKGDQQCSQIMLDFDELVKLEKATDVKIPYTTAPSDVIPSASGTRITLSTLVYGPTASREQTILNEIGDHFAFVENDDFSITLNDEQVIAAPRNFVYAYPAPEKRPRELVDHTLTTEDGESFPIKYRIRFTGEKQHLPARERGVRIYATKRLASVPDLLDLSTGIHGFRNTHYMDGIVYADHLDDREADYISTDRQTLRWDSLLLAPLRAFLTTEMKLACTAFQNERDKIAKREVENDPFTRGQIDKAELSSRHCKFAFRVAKMLAPVCEGGLHGNEYKTFLPVLVQGIGHGEILTSLAKLSAKGNPDVRALVADLSLLTAQEFGEFIRIVQGRLNGINALRKLVETVDFKTENNEDVLHELFKKNPWLIDPTFTQFLTSNQSEATVNKRLAKALQVGKFAPSDYDKNSEEERRPLGKNRRPDLVFVISNRSLSRVVIVELKAPNTPLHGEHLRQLQSYIAGAEAELLNMGQIDFRVEGYLIGSKAKPQSRANEVVWLNDQIKKVEPQAQWKVFDISEVLSRTEDAHREMLDVYEQATSGEEPEDEELAAGAVVRVEGSE